MNYCQSIFCLFLVLRTGTTSLSQPSLRPTGFEQISVATLTNGDLTVTFVDNEAFGDHHKAGYNGIASLVHRTQEASPFVPQYAGFNLEHIFGGDILEELFEPRKHDMELFQRDSNQVLLYQSPTPLSKVESLTTFTMVAPHYIDVTFTCKIHSIDFFQHNYAGFFWASYIDSPEDPNIYLRGFHGDESEPEWKTTYSFEHGVASTHLSATDESDIYFHPDFNATLANHFSDFRYDECFYYGRYRQMVLAYFFDASQIIRFSQSPTGGGQGNPAWDFQYLIPNFIPQEEYSFRARIMYKPFKDVQDVSSEFLAWKEGQK